MTPEEVYEHYGSLNTAAQAIGITRQTAYWWARKGFIPYDKQKRFEQHSKGKLLADPNSEKEALKKKFIENLPAYRFWDAKKGMCSVRSLIFRPGIRPRITYYKDDINKTFTSFDATHLMGASTIKDKNGLFLFEHDIVIFDNEDDHIPFESLDKIYATNNWRDGMEGNFQIIGNTYEGVKSESNKDG